MPSQRRPIPAPLCVTVYRGEITRQNRDELRVRIHDPVPWSSKKPEKRILPDADGKQLPLCRRPHRAVPFVCSKSSGGILKTPGAILKDAGAMREDARGMRDDSRIMRPHRSNIRTQQRDVHSHHRAMP